MTLTYLNSTSQRANKLFKRAINPDQWIRGRRVQMFRRTDVHLKVMHVDWNRKLREVALHKRAHIIPIQPSVAAAKPRERNFGYPTPLKLRHELS